MEGVAVVDVEAGPARAGGGTDDKLGGGRGGADPAYVVRLGAGTDPGGCGGQYAHALYLQDSDKIDKSLGGEVLKLTRKRW